jgi:hypothetical protein
MGKDYMKFIKTIGSTMYFLAAGRYDKNKGGYILDKNSSQQLIVMKDSLTGRVMDMKMPIRGLSVYESIDVFSKHVSGQAKASTSVARKPVTTPTSNVDILGKIAREEVRLAALKKAAGVTSTTSTVVVPPATSSPKKEDPVQDELTREKALEK